METSYNEFKRASKITQQTLDPISFWTQIYERKERVQMLLPPQPTTGEY